MNKLSESLWNWKGEISREKFTKIFVSIIFLLSVVLFFTSKFNILGNTKLTIFIAFIFIAFIFISIQFIKRLHDLNLKAWFHFFSIVPFINILYFLVLLVVPGISNKDN